LGLEIFQPVGKSYGKNFVEPFGEMRVGLTHAEYKVDRISGYLDFGLGHDCG
jgi:hypothetical protein